MVPWKCHCDENSTQLTVGTAFVLRCEGEAPADLDTQLLKIVGPQPDDYRLHLLEFKGLSEGGMELLVTSYETGQHHLTDHKISDGSIFIDLEISPFVVESVLTPGIKVEPYGAFGPLVLPWPNSIWYFIIFLGLLLLSLIGIVLRSVRARRNFLIQLQNFRTPLAPCHQFQKEVRSTLREFFFQPQVRAHPENITTSEFTPMIEKIEHALRVYLTLKFVVPAYKLKLSRLLRIMRATLAKSAANAAYLNSVFAKLRLVFGEFSRCRNLREISRSDLEQIVHLAQEAVNMVEHVSGSKS